MENPDKKPTPEPADTPLNEGEPLKAPPAQKPEPTRFGDWEMNGRCVDF